MLVAGAPPGDAPEVAASDAGAGAGAVSDASAGVGAVPEASAGVGMGVPGSSAELGGAVRDACVALGAKVFFAHAPAEEASLNAAVASAVARAGKIDLLAVDGPGLFAHGLTRGGGHAALRTCVDAAWNATRAVVNLAFLAVPSSPAGRIVYLAPPPDAGEHAPAACAGLENLARTLSVEWARHHVTPVTIAPGATSPPGNVAALTAYLASPAGAYFSGCLLDLRGA